MARPRPRLTSRLLERICAYIRAGAHPLEAAEAAGVSAELFKHWLARPGHRRRGPLFGPAIFEALATARVYAESQAFKTNPLAWLKHGPGKETPDRPGWSAAARAHVSQDVAADDLLDPALQAHFAAVLRALAPYPEARLAVAAALAEPKPDPPE
jgi:hypothetical protein